MTREELTNAIYKNHDKWSCPRDYDCDDTDLDECRKCAERQLAEYENSIRAEERRKCEEEFKSVLKRHWLNGTVAHRIIDEILAEYEKEGE